MNNKSKLLTILVSLGLTLTLSACGDFYFGSGVRTNFPPTYGDMSQSSTTTNEQPPEGDDPNGPRASTSDSDDEE